MVGRKKAARGGADSRGRDLAGRIDLAGEAVEIMTGAALPKGADAVAMVEHVEQTEGEVWAARDEA